MPEGAKISPPPASGAGRDEKHAGAGRWREGSSAQIYGTLSVRDAAFNYQSRLQPFEHAAEARSSPELTPQEQESDLAASGDTSPWESHLAPTPTQSDDEDAISSVTEATSQHQDVASLSKREHEVWDRTLRGYNLCFQYQHKSIEDVDAYHVVLLVRAKNIETLMKKGLYFDQRNVIPRKSFILQNPEVAWVSKSDWKVIRSLELSDTSFFKSWTAVIWVYANTLPPVASFRVTDLTPEKCTEAKGWDKHLIYLYDKRYPELSINTWLDDRPMDGIWPWPRSEQSCSKSPEPRAPTAFTDIPALPRGQPSILLDFVYPYVLGAVKRMWKWICVAFSLLTKPTPGNEKADLTDIFINYIGCMFGVTAAVSCTLLAIFVLVLPFVIYDDMTGNKRFSGWLQPLKSGGKCQSDCMFL